MDAHSSAQVPKPPLQSRRLILQSTLSSRLVLAVLLRLGSGMVIVLMAVIVRFLSSAIPTGEIVFGRSAGALAIVLLFLSTRGNLAAAFATKRRAAQIMRGLTGFAAMALNFCALAFLPIAEAQILMYTSPLFTLLLARLFIDEQIGSRRWLAVVLGFAGAVIMLTPSVASPAASPIFGTVVALLGAALLAAALLQVRSLAKTESVLSITVYFAVVSTVGSIATAGFGWVWPTAEQGLLLVLLGAMGALSHLMMTQSLAYAEASYLAPFEYVNILWATGLGLLVFGEYPSSATAVGAILIATASLSILGTNKTRAPEPAIKPSI